MKLQPFPSARLGAAVLLAALLAPAPVRAQEEIYFSAVDNVRDVLVAHINAERVRVDMSAWYLTEGAVTQALLRKHAEGVPIRLIGDRGSIFEIDALTKNQFYILANAGVPIRIRYNPRSYPEIAHWKATIFAGQGIVTFGSANYTPFELYPTNPGVNYKDESVLFSDDPSLVAAFKMKFDRMWNDTTVEPESRISSPPYFKNWDDACVTEGAPCADYRTRYPNPAPMVIDTRRLEPDAALPPDMVWGQGSSFNNRLVTEINAETRRVDLVIYRLTVPTITQALQNKHAAGVPVRLIVEPNEYRNRKWPEFWLTHAYVDRLWAAGVPIKRRAHQGLTHMKMLVTSRYATNASANFAANWQRDHNYFVPAASKPAIYQAMADRFDTMWSDSAAFVDFYPERPDAPALTSPASGATGVATTTRLTWNRAAFATSYDVYLGTSSGSMVRVANVPAALVQNPPATYSWTPPSPLQGGTTYYWRVVSRTNATGVDPAIAAGSATRSFATSGTVPANPPATPSSPSPANGATGVSASPTLTWSATGATGYQVRFGTTNPPPSAATNLTSASYAPGSLAASTRYYWQVVAANASGTTTGSVWSFTTGAGSSPSPLPAPWQSRDVGNVGQPGSASYSNGRFTVSGAGADIWGLADGFHFLYQALSGDGVVTARLTSMQTTNAYAKAGVMLRTSLAANSPHVVLDMVPGGGIEFMRRTAAGGSTTYLGGTSGARPQWLRLSRSGDTISSFVSGDGSAWTAVGTTTVALGSTIYAGVVVCSHATAALNTSVFDQVTVSSGSGGTPQPPPPAATDVVIYASEIGAGAVHGSWSIGADAGSPNGVALVSTDSGFAANDAPLASPAHYVEVTFNAESGTAYRLWLRLKALNNSKYNDAVWVQFSDARVNGSPVYAIGSTAGLLVNLATGGTATSLNNWGWQNGAYWLSQATAVTFAASGGHTMRIQLREDGVSLDQVVLSPTRYFNSAPGGPTNDTTIVGK